MRGSGLEMWILFYFLLLVLLDFILEPSATERATEAMGMGEIVQGV